MVAGNWKMNTTVDEGVALARAVSAGIAETKGVDVALDPVDGCSGVRRVSRLRQVFVELE